MISTINIAAYSDALVVLGTAGILVPIISRLGISPTLGYLVAGAILGPLGLGSFIRQVPALYWFTVGDAKNVEGIAELGVVFLLFLIGLELSFQRLLTMRRYVFGLGGLQVLLTTGLIAAVAAKTGQKPADAVILGAVGVRPVVTGDGKRCGDGNLRRLGSVWRAECAYGSGGLDG